MNNKIFDDFRIFKKVDRVTMNKYKDVLPGELIAVWKEYGFGSFLNGYLKVINPDEFLDVLKNSYFRADVSIPVFATGLGDLINLEEGKYIRTVKYRKGVFKVIPTFFNWFFSDLQDREFCNRHLDWEQYLKAVKIQGIPAYDECFGYVPLLGLGGAEIVENLQRVKLKEHIMIINEFIGSIQ